MSWSERAHSLLRQGYSEAEAYAIVAAERRAADLDLSMYCPPSERGQTDIMGHGQRETSPETLPVQELEAERFGQLNAFRECDGADSEEIAA